MLMHPVAARTRRIVGHYLAVTGTTAGTKRASAGWTYISEKDSLLLTAQCTHLVPWLTRILCTATGGGLRLRSA
jgi:hypothetical protein